jgi:DNA-binding transcriptional MocR family regulator
MLQNVLSQIEARLAEPTARGLAGAVSRAIGDGVIAPGTRLPPIRTIAIELRLSPTTVSAAWALLARSGAIQTGGRRGTIVSMHRAGPVRYRRAVDAGAPVDLDLSTGIPDLALLPDISAALRRLKQPATPSTYLDDPVLPEFAEILHDDWPFRAERITVVDGAMDGLSLIASTHLRFGDRVGVEQPSFPPLLDLLESVGAVAIPVALDDDGPRPASVRAALDAGIRALFIQPRAQNPTGASLTPARLDQLARVLRRSDVLIVEDDSAGAVASSPALSLGRALPKQTVHIRSYSKSHGPDLRVAAMGGAADLIDPMVDRRFLGQGWTSRLLQGLLVDLLTHTPTIRTIERARRTYSFRRDRMVTRLAQAGITVGGKDGLNLWLPVRNESAALLWLVAGGIGASAGRPFLIQSAGIGPHLRVTVGLVTHYHAEVAEQLAAAAAAGSRPAPR